MPRIYVSSTSKDLEAHRQAVINALHAMQQNVCAMEYYVAEDGRPADVCIRDVENCDIYVGIFAWRYGSTVPWGNPPQMVSITELEYRAAAKKTCLIFLLDEAGTWPDDCKDKISGENDRGERIAGLRKELHQRHMVRFFTTPDALALQVMLSLFKELSVDKPKKFDLPERLTEMADIQQFGSSLMKEIDERVRQAAKDVEGTKYIVVNLGQGESWWSTRLYLLTSLAADFTRVRRVVFVDGDEQFIGMASPVSIKQALSAAQSRLGSLYLGAPTGLDTESAVVLAIMTFRQQLLSAGIPETELKIFVTVDRLKAWLRSDLEISAISTDEEAGPNAFLAHQVIKNPSDFVAVVEHNNRLLGIVDRLELASRIAKTELERHINQVLQQAGRT